MDIKYFILFRTFLFLFIIDNIYSLEEENKIYYIYFDLSQSDFKYENNSERIENIITDSQSIKIPEIKLVKEGFYFNGWTSDFIHGYKPGNFFIMEQKKHNSFSYF